MAPPSALTIATQSVQRLVKEETYYHKEQANQEARIQKLTGEIEAENPDLDSNAEYVLKQEKTALEETKAVFGPLGVRITDAVQKLEEQIAISESDGTASEEQLNKAKEALVSGQRVTAQKGVLDKNVLMP
ncbi:tubulin binding cofactor A [Lasiosphaeria miniovina]|uniref:Tubulin-specific chaperone A n=1 Tax=Lasiosphaeria miniovina TaxID=1954250 RepID=A0AA40EA66_9PEZI|nr:tubulin binding cofactor A [Lasiosphaeria miniovina]KAK0734074.1 tubulin binding cofactor A [Lasiosphaeria miniovina]